MDPQSLRDQERDREQRQMEQERTSWQAETSRTNHILGFLVRRMERIMASVDDILVLVSAERGQIDSLVALTGSIKARLDEALAGALSPAVQAKVDEIFKDVTDNSSAIVKAINANTDTPPAPAPAPAPESGQAPVADTTQT